MNVTGTAKFQSELIGEAVSLLNVFKAVVNEKVIAIQERNLSRFHLSRKFSDDSKEYNRACTLDLKLRSDDH